MESCKDIALMMIGAMAVLLYQKYSKPVMDTVDKTMDKAIKEANKKLDKMM